MHHSTEILFALFIIYVTALAGAELAQRLKFPAVVGEIAAGCLIGPYALAMITLNEPLEVLAELGAVLLLFSVGLETRLGELKKVGKCAALVGILGVVFPFILGFAWSMFSGYQTAESMFIAAALVATSAGITARVLQELKVLDRIESRVIMGAAVIDDILAMLLLGIVTSFRAEGTVHFGALAFVILQAVAFIGLIAIVGTKVVRSKSHLLDIPINPLSALTLSIAICLGLAAASSYIGLAAIIGAFLAGMALAESQQHHHLEKQLQPILSFIVPFFFVVTGAKVNLGELATPSVFFGVCVVTAIAVISKLIGGYLGARSLGHRSAMIIGIGMVPRGEVGIIVASLGLQAGVFSNPMYSTIIAMSLLTSIIAPPALKAYFSKDIPPLTP